MKPVFKRIFKWLLIVFAILNVIIFCHAYKFTHFYEPGEVNIKSMADKSGWDKAKEILLGMNAVKQKNTAPDTIFNTVYFTTQSGLKLEAWQMNIAEPKGTVALFHGHGSKKSSLLPEAAVFRSLGYNTILLDFRAHGNSQGNTCTIGYKEAEDVKLVYDYLQSKGEKNIVLYGVSLGAATITKAINDYQIKPAKIILDMPFGTLTQAVNGRLKMMHVPPQPIGTLLTFWGGVQNGFWAFNLNPCEYAKKIECPVLLQKGRLDPRVTQEETEWIYQNIHTPKKMVIYEQSAHESLCSKEHAKWVGQVAAFLQ